MKVPHGALAFSALSGVLLWLWGLSCWQIFLASTLGFFGLGGLHFCKFVCINLYRDVWTNKVQSLVIKKLAQMTKEKLTVTELFQETVKKYQNKAAIIFEDRSITFKEIDEASNRIANMLHSPTRLQHGDTVAILMDNCPEYVIIYLALSKIGVTGAFINYNLRGDSLAHCIRIANCCGVIFSAAFSDAVAEVLPSLEIGDQLLFSVGSGCSLPQAKSLEGEEIKNASSGNPPPVTGKAVTDKFCYIYTSGTTGLPKACTIRHSRFYGMAVSIYTHSGIRLKDVIYVTLPLYHTNAGILAMGQMLFHGCTVVLRRKFSASNFWVDCIKYKCTVSFYIGELCRYILAQPKRPVDTQHRIRLMIGNGLKAQIWPDFTRRFQIPQISEFYGSTEGVNVNMINPFNRVGACGRTLFSSPPSNRTCLVKVDPDTGAYVRDSQGFCIKAGVNEPGEVIGQLSNSSRFEGYSDPKASEKKVMSDVFAKGDKYFLSGDILRRDEEGFMYFCDRTGDTFRWKGENVSTAEVEDKISNLLKLRDVVVYGVEVPGYEGRAGMAAIESTLDPAADSGLTTEYITHTLADALFQALPSYAVPRFLRLVPSVELTGTFKLKKVQLRKEGFDVSLPDPVFILDMSRRAYQPLTEELYHQLQNGGLRV